jgi:hypothetical protein
VAGDHEVEVPLHFAVCAAYNARLDAILREDVLVPMFAVAIVERLGEPRMQTSGTTDTAPGRQVTINVSA